MEQVPISLYLQLEQGQHANLVVVAKTAVHFASLIEAMASEVFPDAQVSVEAVSASESSLIWNTVVTVFRNVKTGILAGASKHPRTATLAAYVALRMLNNAVDWSQDQIMDWLAGKDAPAEVQRLQPDERRQLAVDIAEELRKGTAKHEANAVFRELRKDRRIIGAGVTSLPKTRPQLLVRPEHFDISDGAEIADGAVRVSSQRAEITVISPVLMAGDRRWKFRAFNSEFGAPMKDQSFLDKVLRGETDIRLQAGLVLDVELETSESVQHGVWTIESRSVLKVHGWRNAPEQANLLLRP